MLAPCCYNVAIECRLRDAPRPERFPREISRGGPRPDETNLRLVRVQVDFEFDPEDVPTKADSVSIGGSFNAPITSPATARTYLSSFSDTFAHSCRKSGVFGHSRRPVATPTDFVQSIRDVGTVSTSVTNHSSRKGKERVASTEEVI